MVLQGHGIEPKLFRISYETEARLLNLSIDTRVEVRSEEGPKNVLRTVKTLCGIPVEVGDA